MLPVTVQECPVVFQPDAEYQTQLAVLSTEAAIEIVDDTTYRAAGESLKRIRACRKAIEREAEEPKSLLNGWIAALRSKIKAFTDPLDAADALLARKITVYDAEMRRKQEEERRKAFEELRRQEEEQKMVAADIMPWEDPPEVAPAVVAVPVVTPPVVTGLSTRNKPWQGRITDLKPFLLWVAENVADRQGLIVGLKREGDVFVSPAINAKAKELQASMGKLIPGTESYQERTVAVR